MWSVAETSEKLVEPGLVIFLDLGLMADLRWLSGDRKQMIYVICQKLVKPGLVIRAFHKSRFCENSKSTIVFLGS